MANPAGGQMSGQTSGCGAPDQGRDLSGVDLTAETVVQGTVTAAGAGVAGAYVRLLDSSGEFTAEVVSSGEGKFRFFARPGTWTVRALAPGRSGEASVTAAAGQPANVSVALT